MSQIVVFKATHEGRTWSTIETDTSVHLELIAGQWLSQAFCIIVDNWKQCNIKEIHSWDQIIDDNLTLISKPKESNSNFFFVLNHTSKIIKEKKTL